MIQYHPQTIIINRIVFDENHINYDRSNINYLNIVNNIMSDLQIPKWNVKINICTLKDPLINSFPFEETQSGIFYVSMTYKNLDILYNYIKLKNVE